MDRLAHLGFDWIWMLSVWQTGPAGQAVSRRNPEWRREFEETLPDLHEEDIAGSGFAITGYSVHPLLGGDAALARLRDRLRNAWTEVDARFRPESHRPRSPMGRKPSRVLRLREPKLELEQAPQNYTRVKRQRGDLDPGSWPRSLLSGLAGYAATRLQQPGHPGGDDCRTAEDRRSM